MSINKAHGRVLCAFPVLLYTDFDATFPLILYICENLTFVFALCKYIIGRSKNCVCEVLVTCSQLWVVSLFEFAINFGYSLVVLKI